MRLIRIDYSTAVTAEYVLSKKVQREDVFNDKFPEEHMEYFFEIERKTRTLYTKIGLLNTLTITSCACAAIAGGASLAFIPGIAACAGLSLLNKDKKSAALYAIMAAFTSKL